MAKSNGKKIDLDTFKRNISNMISTSETSYDNTGFRKGSEITEYTKEEILEIINSRDPEQLQNISRFYAYTSGFYKRFLTYYATLLTYAYLLIPRTLKNAKIEDEKVLKRYNAALDFIDKLGIKNLSKTIAYNVLRDGSYYGILRDFGADGYAVQDLPSKYCRSRFKNQDNVAVIELRLTYFDSIRDNNTRVEVLKGYPREVKNAYNRYKNSNGNEWFMFEPEQSLYFILEDERPFFASILPAIIDFGDYREIEKQKDVQELKSLLIQKLPLEDGELVFDTDEAAEIHRGTVNMMKNNQHTDVITTFADVKVEDTESNRSVIANNLEKIEKSIYSEAGASKQLFSAEGNMALNHSITNDMALMMVLAEQIANWVAFNVNLRFSSRDIHFKYAALPISYYNKSEVMKDSLSLAQSGYSFLIPALALGLEQRDLSDLKALEITALKLDEIMLPLRSSYTTSGAVQDEEVNKISDDQKTDKTIKNIEAMA